MGWTIPYDNTMADTIRELTEHRTWPAHGQEGVTFERTCLARCLRGFVLYAVMQDRYLDAVTGEPIAKQPLRPKWIMVTLLAKGKGMGWGYKDMSDDMGPCEVQCPLAYLKMADPPTSEYGRAYWERVREYHAEQARMRTQLATLMPGDVLLLRAGYSPQSVMYQGRRGRWLLGSGYRILPRQVRAVEYRGDPATRTTNACAKQRTVEQPYEIWRSPSDSWEWRVLKKYQSPLHESRNRDARWFCAVRSPYTYGDWEYGDVYVHEITNQATLVPPPQTEAA